MRINRVQNYNLYTLKKDKPPTFEAHGKPIDLVYIFENRSYLLPQRVKNRVYTILKNKPAVLPSLMQIHTEIYAPLLDCQTLDEAKALFPEFNDISDAVVRYQRRTINADDVEENIKEGFPLKMLQLYWARLLKKDEERNVPDHEYRFFVEHFRKAISGDVSRNYLNLTARRLMPMRRMYIQKRKAI